MLPGAVGRMLLGRHAAGGAIRCLHAARLQPKSPQSADKRWLLVSAGAKEVQAAWELSASDATSGPATSRSCGAASVGKALHSGSSVRGRWLATLPPPKVGLRPKRNVGFHAAVGERHTMALCTFTVHDVALEAAEHCFVVQAASAGSLLVQRFCQKSLMWRQVAWLRHGGFVVLSLAATPMHSACQDFGQRIIVCAGGTEGNITLFDVTTVVHNVLERSRAAATTPPAATPQFNTGPSSFDSSLVYIESFLKLARIHQTGVNAISFTQVGGLAWVVSGGDDQALCVTLLGPVGCDGGCHASGAEQGALCVIETVVVDCAHVSAIKGLCARLVMAQGREAGAYSLQVCSIGWDEFLRVWQVENCDGGDALEAGQRSGGNLGSTLPLRRCVGKMVVVQEIANHPVDVCEPCCVAGCDSEAGSGVWNVAVGGRGTELLSVHV